jgi:hypothetical protein
MIKNSDWFKKWLWFIFCILLFPGQIKAALKFDIYTQDPKFKQEVEATVLKAYAQISAFIEDSLTHPVTIYIAENDSDFRSRLGSDFPDWGIGAAVSGHNLIVLKSPARFRYNRPFSEVLEHELAHIFFDKKVGNSVPPRWMDEGFAMLESREWRIGQDILIVRAVFTNSIIPLAQIENLNSFSDSKAELAYTESYLALSYFLDQYGKDSFFKFLNYLSSGQTLDLAFLNATGDSYIDFQASFVDFLKKKYNWLAFLGDNILFWLVLAFLLVFLYFMKRYYNRKTMKRWEYEDKIGKYDYHEEDQAPD